MVCERFDVMGVNVSRPQRRTKVKYIQANNYDEEPNVFDDSEKFLNESSQQQSAKENTMRGAKNSLKRNQPGFFQLKPSNHFIHFIMQLLLLLFSFT